MAQLDTKVYEAVCSAVSRTGAAVIYAMDHSKLGSRWPSIECLDAIRARWADCVHIVIDACQARLSRARINWYLGKDFLVVLTGSKFFTGPAFSGVLLVPATLSHRLAGLNSIPHELPLYSWRGHWPLGWHGIRAKLGDTPNVGALLRWAAAIEEMRAYFDVPGTYRMRVVRELSTVVPKLIDRCPFLELLPEQRAGLQDQIDDEEMSYRTIFSFLVRFGNAYADAHVCRKIYADLAADLTISLGHPQACVDVELVHQPCHVGQPVTIAMPSSSQQAAALRISVDARSVYQSWEGQGDAERAHALATQLDRFERALKKLELVVAALG